MASVNTDRENHLHKDGRKIGRWVTKNEVRHVHFLGKHLLPAFTFPVWMETGMPHVQLVLVAHCTRSPS